ncbi:alpha/beta fold hydrolase [Lachnoclostridium phytofermentans]|jgi:pimeloyl-ACP methyl ester carboxylesterase|uniref:alpha/beta fold hydrolase n=1 Tax=Lachnoclostridium phytofermentans TaxID=66219 RepID=UPI000497E53C|nr:alpha/beta hydrolase [Lachnoclostridium phytofermentans]
MSVRLHGKPPYQIVLVHPPGIIGALSGVARNLSDRYGVIELIQTRYCLEELLIEMVQDLSSYQEQPIILIGHSYGTWLVGLYALKRAHNIQKLILIGTPPLCSSYEYIVDIKRKLHYNDEEIKEFDQLNCMLREASNVNKQEMDRILMRYGQLCNIADEYQPIGNENIYSEPVKFNGRMYFEIMRELMQMQEKEVLLDYFETINIRIALIHGQYDTHPLEGVLEPFLKRKIPHTYSLLDDCGHTPWLEIGAKTNFQMILDYEIKDAFASKESEKN